MKILVTGGNGFIGKYLLKEFIDNKFEVYTIGLNKSSKKNHFQCDLFNEDKICKILKEINPTHLIHLAWNTEHGKYWSSFLNFNWIRISSLLVNKFYENGGDYALVAGTCAEYSWKNNILNESSELNSNSLYGLSKDFTRKVIQNFTDLHKTKFCWVRIFFPYGYGEHKSRLIPSLIDVVKKNKRPFGVNHDHVRDYIHVSDVAGAINHLIKNDFCGVYNISSSEGVTIEEIVNKVSNFFNYNPTNILKLKSKRNNDPKSIIGDNKLLLSTGWNPKIDFDYGLKIFIKEYLR